MSQDKHNKKKAAGSTIALNKKAGHDYFIEERIEAGIALEGWEVKSLRAGRLQLKESYVRILQGGFAEWKAKGGFDASSRAAGGPPR